MKKFAPNFWFKYVINFIEDMKVTKWTDNDLKKNNFNDIYNSDSWNQFFRFVHDPAILSQRYPCNTCEFVEQCYSCPISVKQAGLAVAETCILVAERSKESVGN